MGAVSDAYQQLRAITLAGVEGWAGHVAGGGTQDGLYVMEVATTNQYRILMRGESYWWVRGLADAYGHGYLVNELRDEPVPALMTVQAAAAALPAISPHGRRRGGAHMGVAGVEALLRSGALYPMFAGGVRYMFAAQIHAQAAARHLAAARADPHPADDLVRLADVAERTAAAWAALRAALPDLIREWPPRLDLPAGTGRPGVLPIPRAKGIHLADRAARALLIGADEGWFIFEYQFRGPDGGREFSVRLTPAEPPMCLPLAGVLAWVLGVADYRGQGARVAYRDGLS